MSEQLTDKISHFIDHARELYHRLVLVVAPSGTGKTHALLGVSEQMGLQYINVNLELSRRLLNVPIKRRPRRVQALLEEIAGKNSDTVLLDNIELLFDASLEQDPLRCLELLSRRTTVVATWNGSVDNRYLIYAAPGHPQHRRWHIQDNLLIVYP
jgi:hypothetical protein